MCPGDGHSPMMCGCRHFRLDCCSIFSNFSIQPQAVHIQPQHTKHSVFKYSTYNPRHSLDHLSPTVRVTAPMLLCTAQSACTKSRLCSFLCHSKHHLQVLQTFLVSDLLAFVTIYQMYVQEGNSFGRYNAHRLAVNVLFALCRALWFVLYRARLRASRSTSKALEHKLSSVEFMLSTNGRSAGRKRVSGSSSGCGKQHMNEGFAVRL